MTATPLLISGVDGIGYDDMTLIGVSPQLLANHTLKVQGHLAGSGAVVTAAAGANAGTTPPAPVTTNTNDTNGTITFGTGTTPAAGAQVVLTFSTAFAAAPKGVCITALNAATQALGLYVSAVSASAITISCTTAPAASQANTVYKLSFIAIG
jgi:hypothetical protein